MQETYPERGRRIAKPVEVFVVRFEAEDLLGCGIFSFAATRLARFSLPTRGWRRGLHSDAASRLDSFGVPNVVTIPHGTPTLRRKERSRKGAGSTITGMDGTPMEIPSRTVFTGLQRENAFRQHGCLRECRDPSTARLLRGAKRLLRSG